ncbi:MAG: hypothetical protein RLZZ196_279 [Bacteroidota bacterium]
MIIAVMITGVGYSQKLPNFLSRSEKRFVQNVIEIKGNNPVEITKRNDSHIVLEFTDAMYVLKPNGYVGEMWILEDEDWIRLPSEEECY